MDIPTIPAEYLSNVVRAARKDHSPDLHPAGCVMTENTLRFNREHGMTIVDMPIRVLDFRAFEKPDEWGSLWYVEVEYNTKGYRAGYGVKEDGTPDLYVN